MASTTIAITTNLHPKQFNYPCSQSALDMVDDIFYRSLVDQVSMNREPIKKEFVDSIDVKSTFKSKIIQLNSSDQYYLETKYLNKINQIIDSFPSSDKKYEMETFKINYNSELELFIDRIIDSVRTTLIVDLETDQLYISYTNFKTKEHEFINIANNDSINKFLNFTYESRVSN